MLTEQYHVKILKTTFNPSLEVQTPKIEEAMRDYLKSILEPLHSSKLSEAKSIRITNTRDFTAGLVAAASISCFLGKEFIKIPRVVEVFKTFNTIAMDTVMRLAFLPYWAKQLYRPFTFELNAIRRDMMTVLKPVVDNRRAMFAAGENVPNDFLQTLITTKVPRLNDGYLSDSEVINYVLLLVFVSMITTATAMYNAVVDLADNPQVWSTLRKEIDGVLNEFDGKITKLGLSKMVYLDSFVRQSLMYQATPCTVGRYITKDIITPSNYLLKAGIHLNILSDQVHRSDSFKSADNTYIYDLNRFISAKAAENDTNATLELTRYATSIGSDMLLFGGGHSACPGRFFSVLEIKSALALMISEYDFVMEEKVPEKKFALYEVVPGVGKDGKEIPICFFKRGVKSGDGSRSGLGLSLGTVDAEAVSASSA
ncbi:hypothetical protein HDU76_012954 [Blyttiomyces sp. JEL0837]|nr:hypothetical protein HDU76_012954 [Blyttiomyces sp. JEL0837]